jgi:predicted short-subunit dehydrogenase-like oxidoreductase (DUF2520 family)
MFAKIAIIGTGNIGTWLFNTLKTQSQLLVTLFSSRKIEMLTQDCDLYIFALKDDVYEDVLQQIPFRLQHAVHTSGSLSQQILAPYSEKYGVVYPYQTILQKAEKNLTLLRSYALTLSQKTPICIEASDTIFVEILFEWANSVFKIVHIINEQQRFAMHLAAVFASNFTNAMYGIAYQIFQENHLDWSLIYPLLENTLEKAKFNDPNSVQTGPASRNDTSIMQKHISAMQDEELKTIYALISKKIQKL